ncbi:MAG TPA: alpha/beta fold hydrolase [Candidatus Lustribacter sp.]
MQKQGSSPARDGADLRYTLHESGRPEAPRIALVHSLALDRSIWDGVVAALGTSADILVYDCRGHGASAKPPGPYTTELFAGDLRDLLAAVGWQHSFIAGASMGGSVVLQFAVSHPELVDGLGLIDTTAWYGADAPKTWHERGQKAVAAGLASLIAFQQTRWFSDGFRTAHADLAERFAQVFLKNDLAAYAATCDMLGGFDLRSKLATIAVPVEILVGEEDYATPPEMARALEAGITGSHLTIVPSARHLTPIEIPERIASMLQTVIARKDGSVANRR